MCFTTFRAWVLIPNSLPVCGRGVRRAIAEYQHGQGSRWREGQTPLGALDDMRVWNSHRARFTSVMEGSDPLPYQLASTKAITGVHRCAKEGPDTPRVKQSIGGCLDCFDLENHRFGTTLTPLGGYTLNVFICDGIDHCKVIASETADESAQQVKASWTEAMRRLRRPITSFFRWAVGFCGSRRMPQSQQLRPQSLPSVDVLLVAP